MEWNEEGTDEEKRESKYLLLQTACFDFHSPHVSGIAASFRKWIKHSWLTSRGNWWSKFYDGGNNMGKKDEDPHSTNVSD